MSWHKEVVHTIEPLIGGLIPTCRTWWTWPGHRWPPIEPLIGGLILNTIPRVYSWFNYWTPYRGIDISLREWGISNEKVGIKCSFAFLRKGSGGGVVYGFGVWRVKSWVKNVLNTNKYIAVFFNKMGMIVLDISTACVYNFWKEHYLVLLNPL